MTVKAMGYPASPGPGTNERLRENRSLMEAIRSRPL